MKKFIRISFSIVAFFIILFTVRHYYIQYDMKKIVQSEEAREVIEQALKNEDPKAFTEEGVIKSYKVDSSSVRSNPLGGIMMDIIINNDSQLVLKIILTNNDNNIEISKSGYSKNLYKIMKG